MLKQIEILALKVCDFGKKMTKTSRKTENDRFGPNSGGVFLTQKQQRTHDLT
jgi:hypothetical protein